MSTTTAELDVKSANVEVSPSGKIINNGDDGLAPISPTRRKIKKSSSRKNVSDTEASEAPVTKNKFSKRSRSSTVKSTNQTKGSTSKTTVKVLTPSSKVGTEVASSQPAERVKSKTKGSKDSVSTKSSKVRKNSIKKGRRNKDLSAVSLSMSNTTHRIRKSKSKVVKTNMVREGDDSKLVKVEPPFFTTISPEFFTRLKQMANESNTNNLKSSSSSSSRREDSKKSEAQVKMETLSKLDQFSKENFRKLKKSKGSLGGTMTFQEAREALSLDHVPEALLATSKNEGKKEMTGKNNQLSTKVSTLSDLPTTNVDGQLRSSGSLRSQINKSILCHGAACNIKKHIRFADHNEAMTSCSNTAQIRTGNLLGGCTK